MGKFFGELKKIPSVASRGQETKRYCQWPQAEISCSMQRSRSGIRYYKLCNSILRQGTMPLTWCGGLTYYTPSYKAGGRSDPANYRGICVSSCLGKLFCSILNQRLLDYVASLNVFHKSQIATRTITKNRFVSERSHETPRTESDKHCDQNKANVWAGAAVVILKAKILVNSSVYRFRNKRNGRHQTLLLGWVQNRLKISRKMAGITKRVGEIGVESIHSFPETGERPRKVQALVSNMFTGILYGEKR